MFNFFSPFLSFYFCHIRTILSFNALHHRIIQCACTGGLPGVIGRMLIGQVRRDTFKLQHFALAFYVLFYLQNSQKLFVFSNIFAGNVN